MDRTSCVYSIHFIDSSKAILIGPDGARAGVGAVGTALWEGRPRHRLRQWHQRRGFVRTRPLLGGAVRERKRPNFGQIPIQKFGRSSTFSASLCDSMSVLPSAITALKLGVFVEVLTAIIQQGNVSMSKLPHTVEAASAYGHAGATDKHAR